MAEGRVLPELLAYRFGVTLRKAFKNKPTVLAQLEDIVPALMEDVPSEAFEPPDPFYHGYIWYHQDVESAGISDLNALLVQAHLSLKKGMPIRLVLTSEGGSSYDSLAVIGTIHDIQRAGRDVNIHVPGYAMSAATDILMAGTKRSMESTGWLMVHNTWWQSAPLRVEEHHDELETQQRMLRSVLALYAQRTTKDLDWWIKHLDRRDRYFTAQEALELRLVDEVLPAVKYRRFRQVATDEEE